MASMAACREAVIDALLVFTIISPIVFARRRVPDDRRCVNCLRPQQWNTAAFGCEYIKLIL